MNRFMSVLACIVFALIPMQKRLRGVIDSWSKALVPVDLSLPPYFSKSIHLTLIDPFIVGFIIFAFCRNFVWRLPSKILTLFFAALLLSILFSSTAHYPLQYLLLLHTSLAFLFFMALVSLRLPLVRPFIWILLVSASLESLLAITQYVKQGAVLSWLEVNYTNFSAFPNPLKQRWLFDTAEVGATILRSRGTFLHPNVLGAFLSLSILATCALYFRVKRRSLLLIPLALQIAALYVSYSRAAFFSLAVSLALFFFLLIKQRLAPLKTILFALGALCTVTTVGLIIFFAPLLSRGGIVAHSPTTSGADSERLHYLKMAAHMVKDHPFFGIGFNNFQLIASPTQEGMPGHVFSSKVHNIYALIAAEAGLLGLVLFLWFLYAVLRPACTSPPSLERAFLLSGFVALLFMGGCDFFLLETSSGRLLFFSFAALLYVHSTSSKRGLYEKTV